MPKYTQKFKAEWLRDPLFAGWLTVAEGPEGAVAMCAACDRSFSRFKYNNLKKHSLCGRHQSNMMLEPKGSRQYRISSKLWNHFERLEGDVARCKYCRAELAHGDSVAALQDHLESEHPTVKCADTQVRSTAAIARALRTPTSKKLSPADRKVKLEKTLTSQWKKKDEDDICMDYEEIEELIFDDLDVSLPEETSYLDNVLRQPNSDVKNEDMICESNFTKTQQTYECKTPKTALSKEDSIGHFGKYMMSLLRKLPENLALKMQLQLSSLVLNAVTKYEMEAKNVTNITRLEVTSTSRGYTLSNTNLNTISSTSRGSNESNTTGFNVTTSGTIGTKDNANMLHMFPDSKKYETDTQLGIYLQDVAVEVEALPGMPLL